MKSVDGRTTQEHINISWRKSRQRLRYLEQFSNTLSQLNLTPHERDRTRSLRMMHAAELCITRGQLRIAQKLLTRAYSSATRLGESELAMEIAQTRVELEHVFRNSAAIRLWSSRAHQWNMLLTKTHEERSRNRQLFYESVLGIRRDERKMSFNQYVCDELRHIILPYQYCSLGSYVEARELLEIESITRTSSVFLKEEVAWLQFRICCTLQRYSEAKEYLITMKNSTLVTKRLREYVRIGERYSELMELFYCEGGVDRLQPFSERWFVDSLDVVRHEASGMFLSVLVYELTLLLLKQRFTVADKRLAALRARIYRLQSDKSIDELRIFTRVVGYVLATSHRHRRVMPRQLLAEFQECSVYVPYPQQGIIPYSELAYRLVRYLGYK